MSRADTFCVKLFQANENRWHGRGMVVRRSLFSGTAIGVLLALGMTLGGAAMASPPQASPVNTGAVPVPASGAYLGLLTSMPGLTNAQSLAYREAQFSRTFQINSHY